MKILISIFLFIVAVLLSVVVAWAIAYFIADYVFGFEGGCDGGLCFIPVAFALLIGIILFIGFMATSTFAIIMFYKKMKRNNQID